VNSAFEAAIIADYDAQSSVERELVLLASILWRLRRATAMEAGLFEIERKLSNQGASRASNNAPIWSS
jgi:hypothetical protein